MQLNHDSIYEICMYLDLVTMKNVGRCNKYLNKLLQEERFRDIIEKFNKIEIVKIVNNIFDDINDQKSFKFNLKPDDKHYIIISYGGIYEYIVEKSERLRRKSSILLQMEERNNIDLYHDNITIENTTDEQIIEVLKCIVSLPNYKKEMKKEY